MNVNNKLYTLPDGLKADRFYQNRKGADIAAAVLQDIESVADYFVAMWARAYRNQRFYANDQWSISERIAFARQRRIAYVWNEIAPVLNNLIGQQQRTQMDTRVLAVDSADEKLAAISTRLVKWFEQANAVNTIASEVFKHTLLQGTAVTQTRWEFSDFLYGYPKVERVPLYEMVWDLSNVHIDMSGCRWQARVMPMTAAAAIEQFPEFEEEIYRGATYRCTPYSLFSHALHQYHRQNRFRYYELGTLAREQVYVVLHFERVKRTEHLVLDGAYNYNSLNQSVQKFDTFKEANDFARGLHSRYAAENIPLYDSQGNALVAVLQRDRDAFLQTTMVNDLVLEHLEIEMPDFPFSFSHANFADGESWSVVDGMIYPQRFQNRTISSIDEQVTRAPKNLKTIVKELLADGWTVAKAQEESAKPNAMIPAKGHDVIKIHENPSSNSDFSQLLGFAQGFMMRNAGGENALGLAANAAESSKTVRARQEAAGMGRVQYFTNLELWRKSITEQVVWYMQRYLTPQYVKNIVGVDLEKEGYDISEDDILDTLRETRQNVVVSSTPDTELAREQVADDLRELFTSAQGSIPFQVFLPMMIKVSKLDSSLKQELLSTMEYYQKMLQEQAAQGQQEKIANNAQKAVQGEVAREQLRDQVTGPGQIAQQYADRLGQ